MKIAVADQDDAGSRGNATKVGDVEPAQARRGADDSRDRDHWTEAHGEQPRGGSRRYQHRQHQYVADSLQRDDDRQRQEQQEELVPAPEVEPLRAGKRTVKRANDDLPAGEPERDRRNSRRVR